MYNDINKMISPRQLEIYNNLMAAVASGDSFYTVDQQFDGVTYRVFAYRLSSYSDFLLPDAKEARGIMFEMKDDVPVRLASRTPHKFFNLNENPFTMNLDISKENVDQVMDKADGSLISTFITHKRGLALKSKTSVGSDQVKMANAFLDKPENALLRAQIFGLALSDFTVNMEYTGPDNRIVIGYMEPKLTILSIRNNETGEYMGEYRTTAPDGLTKHRIKQYPQDYDFVGDSFKDQIGNEGVVVVLKTGEWFKVKTPWYAALHKTKDSINSKKKLFEAIVCETADDLKSLFFDDPLAMQLINEMEAKVLPMLKGFIASVEAFYAANKDLDRKSYAIKGQQELQREVFSNAMSKYLGREVNYKEWAIKHIELFGVKDEPTPVAKEE